MEFLSLALVPKLWYISDMVLLKSTQLPVGEWKAPDFKLPGTDGETYSLSDFSHNKGLLVVFICNHCPYAKAAWPQLIALADEYKEKRIAFVGINPNDEVNYPEDSFEQMKQKVKEWGINFPYLQDKSQEVAKVYDAQCTPDVYLFKQKNKQFVLYYRGRITDNWQEPEKAESHDLKDAVDSLLAGSPPLTDQIPSMGCSIKWK